MSRLAVLALALAAAVTPAAAQSAADTLRPITLPEAIRRAQQNAPSTIQARGNVRSANAEVTNAYGAFLPTLTGSLGEAWSRGDRLGPQGNLIKFTGPAWSYSSGLSMNMNLFDGGRRIRELQQARAEVDVAEASEVTQRFNVALQVKQQYYAILAARESESAARAQLEQAEQQLSAAVTRVRAGVATLSDSLRSVIQVGNARLALLNARNNVSVASAALTRLVGSSDAVTASPADTLDAPAPLPSPDSLFALAERGPAVEQAENAVRAASAGRRAARTGYFPSIDLRFNRGGNGYDNLWGFNDRPYAYSSSMNLAFSWPLFNNFTREANITRASVALTTAEAQLRDARLGARATLVQQLAALRTAEERERVQLASVAAAREDLRVQQQRYNVGASTLLDLLTSQSALDQARLALIQARQDRRVARAQIEALIGKDLP